MLYLLWQEIEIQEERQDKMKSRSVQHLHSINVQDEYGTPSELFQNICKKYNIYPQIDVCASKTNHVLPNYITKEKIVLVIL